MLSLFILTLTSLQFMKTESVSEVPSFKIIINQSGVKKLEDVLFERINVFEEKFSSADAVKIPDVLSSSYKIKNLHVSRLKMQRPEVQIVPGTGLRMRQGISRCVVEGDYKIKALFFWVDGKITLTTSLTLEVTAGVDYTKDGKLTITSKTCRVDFQSFNLDLHNVLFSAVAKLMKGTITESVEKSLCEQISKSFRDFDIMDQIPYEDTSGKVEVRPGAIFKADSIEFYARLPEDTNLNPMPDLTNKDNRMICLILSKKLIENSSGKQKIDKMEVLKKAKKFLPVLSEKNVDFKEMDNFFEMCSDLELKDVMEKSADKF